LNGVVIWGGYSGGKREQRESWEMYRGDMDSYDGFEGPITDIYYPIGVKSMNNHFKLVGWD
jgi:hypothetical protein